MAAVQTPPAPLALGAEGVFPARFVDLKHQILPDGVKVVNAWNEIITELAKVTKEFNQVGPEIIPQVDFKDLHNLTPDELDLIKRRGSVVIRNVVNDEEALEWKRLLREYVDLNPHVDGFPADDKQFFEMYWSRSQLEARSHPNVLAASTWLNNFFHIPEESVHVAPESGAVPSKPLVSLSTPLSYADRFRIRKPGPVLWTVHNPHIDGGSIERWEDAGFRDGCYKEILDGHWRKHDAYDMRGRLLANTNKYGRPNQCSVFRTWQGWLAMSDTGPTEGTLRLFPDVLVSNAYLLLRPFFSPVAPLSSFKDDLDGFLSPSNWKFDNSNPEFPGIHPTGTAFGGQRLDTDSHPHMRLASAMVSVPRVAPGDMVFWHSDVVHSVETEHHGAGDSSVMYIPAVPLTPLNLKYIARQRENFLKGFPAPDFPQQADKDDSVRGEVAFVKKGVPDDVGRNNDDGKRAMGLGDKPFDIPAGIDASEVEILKLANKVLYGQD